MGAGSKQARTFWLQNLIQEIQAEVEARGVARFNPPRQDGAIPLARIVELLGRRGILVRQVGDDSQPCYAARDLAKLGIKEQAN